MSVQQTCAAAQRAARVLAVLPRERKDEVARQRRRRPRGAAAPRSSPRTPRTCVWRVRAGSPMR